MATPCSVLHSLSDPVPDLMCRTSYQEKAALHSGGLSGKANTNAKGPTLLGD